MPHLSPAFPRHNRSISPFRYFERIALKVNLRRSPVESWPNLPEDLGSEVMADVHAHLPRFDYALRTGCLVEHRGLTTRILSLEVWGIWASDAPLQSLAYDFPGCEAESQAASFEPLPSAVFCFVFLLRRIMELIDELEKPWKIRCKAEPEDMPEDRSTRGPRGGWFSAQNPQRGSLVAGETTWLNWFCSKADINLEYLFVEPTDNVLWAAHVRSPCDAGIVIPSSGITLPGQKLHLLGPLGLREHDAFPLESCKLLPLRGRIAFQSL